ncbi:DUF4315 family protein [Lacrimispora xylanisolvens]|uniref:DUF4315 family protein n=1 Tax=Lacrimispora xylanisolvens TaxID=384636 RepID=UPI002402714A
MNTRLKRVLEEIQKTEKRIAEWQEHLKELHVRRKQMEDAEIIKSVRSMKLDSRQLLEVLERIQNGAELFLDADGQKSGADTNGLIGMEFDRSEDAAENKEDDDNESKN